MDRPRIMTARLAIASFAVLAAVFAFGAAAYAAPPTIGYLRATNPIGYELKSLQVTHLYAVVNNGPAWAKLTVATPGGAVVVFDGAVAGAGAVVWFPAWNGLVNGQRLPSASYTCTLRVNRGSVVTTLTSKITISKICFTMKGHAGPAPSIVTLSRYVIPGTMNIYAHSTASDDGAEFSLSLSKPAYVPEALPIWQEQAIQTGTPWDAVEYLRGGNVTPLRRGMQDFVIAGNDLDYVVTVIQ